MRDFRSIFKTSTKWTHALMSLIYFKQFFSIGEEYKLLNLEYILYSPIIMLLWMYCFYFWSARIKSIKDYFFPAIIEGKILTGCPTVLIG